MQPDRELEAKRRHTLVWVGLGTVGLLIEVVTRHANARSLTGSFIIDSPTRGLRQLVAVVTLKG
jgi:hypothetical protein